jgi:hypothetical protein
MAEQEGKSDWVMSLNSRFAFSIDDVRERGS